MARVLPKVDSLTFKKEELDQLDIIIGNIPAAYAVGVVDMFRLVNHHRTLEAAEALKKQQPPGSSEGNAT
jgi:hypothetical protein